MKKSIFITKVVLGAAVVLCSLNSCKKEPKEEDPKEVAEDQNEAKFEESDKMEDDSELLVNAAEYDMAEIEIGTLAQQKGMSKEVKDFGKMLVTDHTKSSDELKALAAKKNISLPTSVTEMVKEEYNDLNKKSGAEFDEKFAQLMVDGHQKAIDKMNKITEKATDEEIKLWASNKIPGLTAHLEHAKRLKEKMDK